MKKISRSMRCFVCVAIMIVFIGGCTQMKDSFEKLKSKLPKIGQKAEEPKQPEVKTQPVEQPKQPEVTVPPEVKEQPKQPEKQPEPKPTPTPIPTPTPTPTPEPTPALTTPDVQRLINTGVTYLEAGEINDAITAFEDALKLDPKNVQAAESLKKTQDEKQRLIQLYLNEGIKYFNQDLLEDAIREWDKVLVLDPQNQEASDYKERAKKRLDALKPKP